MGCDPLRDALSARLDGEDPGLGAAVLDHHLATCRACAAWHEGLTRLHRELRVRAADPIPDQTAAILANARRRPAT